MSPNPNQKVAPPREGAPGPGDAEIITANEQDHEGPLIHLRGFVRIETATMSLTADEVDYDQDTGEASARGHVHYENYVSGEKLFCDHANYNTQEETGQFYEVSGTAPSRIEARPGLLTTTNPFYFQGKWAERKEGHYIIYNGFITDCDLPNPWWRLQGPKFDILPRDHAIAHSSWFYVRKIPLFYAPALYKSLKKEPRRSGFLTPNIGHSSLRGMMAGFGYFWAINRSYDLTYRAQYFSSVGINNVLDFRGKVNETTDFNLTAYALSDHSSNPSVSRGGYLILFDGKSQLPEGWEARGHLDILSSFLYRQEFSESINEAIFSETHSVGFLTKHWSDYGINFVAERNVNYQTTTPGDQILLRKLPEFQFTRREHAFNSWPVYFSFEASDGLEHRSQPQFQTRQFVDRTNFAPRVTAAFHWLDMDFVPSFTLHETFYDSSFVNGQVTGNNLWRNARDFNFDWVLPSLARVFDAPSWMGDKVKHVIEPRISYRYVTGIDNFNNIIRFDQTDILSNTNEVAFSLTNRLLAKDKNGNISDVLSWQLLYKRFFDPTFGGAVIAGQRNVVESVADMTGFTFLDGPRHQSPIASVLRYQSRIGIEWRTDYDPVQRRFVNSTVNVDAHIGKWSASIGNTAIRTDPVLAPNSNQMRFSATYGNQSRRGWNYGASAFYDYRIGKLEYTLVQATYNTDCCGISAQYRRFSFGTRNETQYLVSFAVSNIATFGTLKRQERIF
ncbi:MAG: LPS-assembly protein LptD [Bryobacterales bacterium]|nr:LPS-assembly protein LptD [Bryobacterales bacterium]MBV9401877.1 LPS-assembly protein LptD [Bryobacterales bacterium]